MPEGARSSKARQSSTTPSGGVTGADAGEARLAVEGASHRPATARRWSPQAEQVALFAVGSAPALGPAKGGHDLPHRRGGVPGESVRAGSYDSSSVFLTALEVITRYGWGRTKGYRMLRTESFPRPIGGDRYRLDTLIDWEDAQLAAAPPAQDPPRLPARNRGRAS